METEKRKIALVGFRATGKSRIGKGVAESLGWPFVDMDDRLTEQFGRTIEEWVRCFGWESFRDEELRLLAALGEGAPLVVATGGGVVLRPENRGVLRDRFFVVWLRARKDTISRRLAGDPRTASHRPPLTNLSWEAEIEALLSERKPLYEDVANLALDTDDLSAEAVVTHILEYVTHLNDRLP